MKKREFLAALAGALSALPQEEREERLSFYGEMIDDRIEEGLSEEEAVADIGSVDAAAADILGERAPVAAVKEDKPKRKTWQTVLLILGAPVWAPLLIAAAAVVLAGFVVLWALIAALWAVFASLAAGGVGGIAFGITYAAVGDRAGGLGTLAAGLIQAGLAIFLFFACKAATTGAARLTKKFALWLKARFTKKEEA